MGRNLNILKQYGLQFYTYEALPAEAKLAIEEYRSEYDTPATIRRRRYGLAQVPLSVVADIHLRDANRGQAACGFDLFADFAAYHRECTQQGDTPSYPSGSPRWPCIISSLEDEFFEDGHHRFHAYVNAGDTHIPCLYVGGVQKRHEV